MKLAAQSRMPAERCAWEAAEVTRSAVEARLIPDERLHKSGKTIARYMNPALTTIYPLEYAFALLGDVRGQTVLDLGCGSGENTHLLVLRGARVIGVDISADLVRLARRRLAVNGLAGRADLLVASAHDLPLDDRCVDVVFGMAILHHLDLEAAARQVRRVLKPGGRAIFKEPVRDSAVLRTLRRMLPQRDPDVSPFERPLTIAELRRFAGVFDATSLRAFSLPFVNLINRSPAMRRRFIHPAHQADARLLRAMPPLARYAGVYVLEAAKLRSGSPTYPRA
jgi:SAM-dependent methyltransferase